MNMKPIEGARDPDLRLSKAALQRAARRAHELAAQTGTSIVVSRSGVVELIEPVPGPGRTPAPGSLAQAETPK